MELHLGNHLPQDPSPPQESRRQRSTLYEKSQAHVKERTR